jgi:hypothetical protein
MTSVPSNRFSADNSSSTALGSSATFTGTGINVRNQTQVRIEVFADQPSADAGVEIQFSNDNATWNISKNYTLEANRKREFYSTTLGEYCRVVYTNGATPQTIFYLRTVALTTKDDITSSVVDKLDTGIKLNAAYVDTFSRLRISNPQTLFDASFLTTSRTDIFDELNTGDAGTIGYTSGTAYVSLSAPLDTTAKVVRQSYQYIPYQPGKSRLAFLTGVLEIGGGATGSTSRIGIFDDAADKTEDAVVSGDGFFFELAGTALRVVERAYANGSQLSDNVVEQADWNIDRLDGTGNSGITIDPSKRQIFVIEQEWLGVGSVFMGFVVDAAIIRCHEFSHANETVSAVDDAPYTSRASLPVRYELSHAATGAATEMRQICASVISEGGYAPVGRFYMVNRGRDNVSFNDNETFLIAVRPTSARPRVTLAIRTFNVSMTQASNCLMQVYLVDYTPVGGTEPIVVTPPGQNWVAASPNSAAEFVITPTSFDPTLSTVILKYSLYIAQDVGQAEVTLPDPILVSSSIAGLPQACMITLTDPDATTGDNSVGSIGWTEYE